MAVLPKYKSAFDDNLDEKPAAKSENGADVSEKKYTNDGMKALLLAIADF